MFQEDECDWFDKDEDDLVKDLKSKTLDEEDNGNSVEYIAAITPHVRNTIDYTASAAAPKKLVPTVKLREAAKVEAVDAFLFTATVETDFLYDQIAHNDSMERVLLYVRVLVKILDLELPGYYGSTLKAFTENRHLLNHLVDISKKLFVQKYKAIWTDSERADEVFSDMGTLFERAHQERLLESDHCRNTIIHISQIIERSDLPAIVERPICQRFIRTLDRIISDTGTVNPKDTKEIYPSLEELVATDPKVTSEEDAAAIAKNLLLTKEYNNISEYITVQKYLLREDFMISLRECVNCIKTKHATCVPNCAFLEDVYILMNQKFLEATRSQMLFVDILGSRRKDPSRVDKATKRSVSSLKTGSLLCFTTSFDFENLVLAIVTHTEQLEEGYIFISVVRQYNIGPIYERSLIMFESPAFFEPYIKVFNVLKSYGTCEIPMHKYILSQEVVSAVPAYLQPNAEYIYKGVDRFHPLEDVPKNLKLNYSQKIAFKNALSREFCLIQGPPGTGKTHLSVEMVTTLAENSKEGPIVLVAYTNDSLDKFLLKIARSTEDIVRFGTRSKVRELAKFAVNDEGVEVNPLLKRLYYHTNLSYKEQFCALQKLYQEFDGTEENYQLIVAAQEKLCDLTTKSTTIHILFKYYSVKNKKIIAMTTTYAAKVNYLFKLLKAPIVVFEEAAEILESHVLACLTRYTQHVIMVGDHRQLQPFPSSYYHSRVHQLNISLFERLINRKMAHTTLDTQYRMRPELALLICPLIYKDLENAPVVNRYEDVKGMDANLFFLSHEQPESDEDEHQISKCNAYEARKLVDLAVRLVSKGESGQSIVLLTPYTKQMELLSKMLQKKSTLRNIKVDTVDTFQGMEADIVLLSLVRSNNKKDIGFLREKNRICVALSRAKRGLYMIGNMNLLSACSKVWKGIEEVLIAQNAIGDTFPCGR